MLDLFQSAVNAGFFLGAVGIGYVADRWVPRPRLERPAPQITQAARAPSTVSGLDGLGLTSAAGERSQAPVFLPFPGLWGVEARFGMRRWFFPGAV